MQQVSKGQYLGTTMASRTLSNFVLVESKYDAGQDLKSHAHERAFISILLQGSYRERCGSSDLSYKVGQVVFHGAGEVHADHFYEDGHCINLEIQPPFANRLRQYGIDKGARMEMSSRHYAAVGSGKV